MNSGHSLVVALYVCVVTVVVVVFTLCAVLTLDTKSLTLPIVNNSTSQCKWLINNIPAI